MNDKRPSRMAGDPRLAQVRLGSPFFANNQTGFTLLELIITLTIIAILVAGTVPVANNMIKREKERELRRNLREIRQAIDSYHINCRPPKNIRDPIDTNGETDPVLQCYPKNLSTLRDGIKPPNSLNVYRYLRRIPKDPFTGSDDWELLKAGDSGGEHVFDVRSRAQGTALDGTKYGDW